MKIESGKCPNCGAVINFNPDKEFATCEYCGVTHPTTNLKNKHTYTTQEIILTIVTLIIVAIMLLGGMYFVSPYYR